MSMDFSPLNFYVSGKDFERVTKICRTPMSTYSRHPAAGFGQKGCFGHFVSDVLELK